MNSQISLDEMMPDANVQQRVEVLLVKLGIRYGKTFSLSDFYPQYSTALFLPTSLAKKIAEELHKELQATDILGDAAKNTLTLEQKLIMYNNAIDMVLQRTPLKKKSQATTWQEVKRLINGSITVVKPLKAKDALFLEFKEAYPINKNMGRAESWFKAHKPSQLLVEKMLFALETQKNSLAWEKENGKYIPNPYTWLNAKAWENEATSTEPTQGSNEILQKAMSTVPVYKKIQDVKKCKQ